MKLSLKFIIAGLLLPTALKALTPPRVPEKQKLVTTHGDVRNDEFSWLREDQVTEGKDPSEALKKVLLDQNSHTDKVLQPNLRLKSQLQTELRNRQSALAALAPIPVIQDGYEYWNKTQAGEKAPVFFRKKLGSTQTEILIDGPALASNEKFFDIVPGPVSPSGSLLPYMVDLDGDRQGTLFVKDLKSGNVRTIRESDVKATPNFWKMAWGRDDQSLYYSVPGKIGRDTRVVRAILSETSIVEEEVFDEIDPDFYLLIKESASKKYIFLWSNNSNFTVFRAVDKDNPNAPLLEFNQKRSDHKFEMDHVDGKFLFQSNRDGKVKFWTAPESLPTENNWQLLKTQEELPEAYESTVFKNHLFFSGYSSSAEQQGVVVRLSDGAVRKLPKSDPTVTFKAIGNVDPNSRVVRLKSISLIQPTTILEVDLITLRTKILSKIKLPGYDASQFIVQRKNFDSSDGAKVPAYIAKRKRLANVSTPALVSAYGHYATPTLAVEEFDIDGGVDNYSLLNRGVALVVALPRGVGDLGEKWALEGAYLNKRNTFLDTVAVLRGLTAQNLSKPDKIAFRGYSAGGLNSGYVANEAPDALKAIVGAAPFIDILNTMLDDTLPMTTQEFADWGNPIKNASDYALIKSYSPYENIRSQNYPSIYATMSLSDSQVAYWEPIKWIARLQKNQKGHSPILLRMYMEGGHGGGVGEDALAARAEEQAFILSEIGVK